MRIERLVLAAYGRCQDVGIDIGAGLTVVLGANEAGKSTSLDALGDFLWGIPRKSPRTSDFPRAQLRIDAVLTLADGECTAVRKGTGLFAADQVTEFPPPWNPDGQLNAAWWRTRMGLDHAGLRAGGHEVFTGGGDLADIIFAAREGRSAREVLKKIADAADALFKPDGRSRNVKLRLAANEYDRAVQDRQSRLTAATEVVDQRTTLRELEGRQRHLRDAAAATGRALKLAEENRRVIGAVLEFGQATRELAAIDAEGARLTPDELADYDTAADDSRNANARREKLSGEIEAKTTAIEELSVDDRLLDDQDTFDRLHSDRKARMADLQRAGEEFGADAAEAAGRLRELLADIGIEVCDDPAGAGTLDVAVSGARVRQDHAATLDELADQLDDLEEQRRHTRDERDRALRELTARGVSVDLTTSTPPDEKTIARHRQALIEARDEESKAQTRLDEATAVVAARGAAETGAPVDAVLTQDAVIEARAARDERWAAVRRSWVSGELPDPADRVDMAAELDSRSAAADRIADDEATERARVAARDARAGAPVEGLEAARENQRVAHEARETAVADHRRAQAEWDAMWADLGVSNAPDTDDSSAVVTSLATAHVEHGRQTSVAERLAELAERWCAAAEQARLDATMTTVAWRRRKEVLEEIESVAAQRTRDRNREVTARANWERFLAEATDLLRRHGVIDADQPADAAVVEQGFTKLKRRLDTAVKSAAMRTGYLDQIAEKRIERDEVEQAQRDAVATLRRLVETRAVDGERELAVLAERAGRAAEPLARQADSTKAVKNGLDPGADLQDVINRLADQDEVSTEQAVDEARRRDEQAREAVDQISSECTSARDRLSELERAAGAAEAEAKVVSRQAEVARLTETWAVLALQRKLLENVLEDLAAGDTRPLLDHAGRLLERLTDGRWVALHAVDDAVTHRLQVIRADNTPCDPSKLSEGTVDQVFLALRLAAVAELHRDRTEAGEVALPLVLDDVLMAFDEVRVRRALEILASLAPGLQIIVFTHHRHVADAAADLAGVTVSRLPDAAPIADVLDADLIRSNG